MKYAALLTALLLCLLTTVPAVAAGPTPEEAADTGLFQRLERYLGRDLTVENRAKLEGVRQLLPQSCPPFHLRDQFGGIINPIENPDVSAPISTRMTCGAVGCHEDYDTVVEGYHFQSGKDELYAPAGLGEQPSVDKSPGFYGKWQLLYQRELAPVHADSAADMDLTSFEWVRECAVCHVGGGPAEFDRGGRRYSEVMANEPSFTALALNGDYYQARWHESGVLEADCFICHAENYDYSLRAEQIKKYNYQWAATVGTTVASIEGAVADGEIPKLKYNPGLFLPDGKIHMHIQRPSDRACQTCHELSSVQKRGSGWHSHYMQDIHTERNLKCTDCHVSDIRHNFAKGHSSSQSVRDDLDGNVLSCEQCHYEEGEYGAPAYYHAGFPPLHLERIDCTGCHITTRPYLQARIVEVTNGKIVSLPNDPNRPRNTRYGAKWATSAVMAQDAVVDPIAPSAIDAAANVVVSADSPIRAKVGKGIPEEPFRVSDYMASGTGLADTADKRMVMLLALQQVLGIPDEVQAPEGDASEDRHLVPRVFCIFRDRAYMLAYGSVQRRSAKFTPDRIGDLIEWQVALGVHEREGKEKIYAEGYNVSAFWLFNDGSRVRPVYPKEMAAAWNYFHNDEYQFLLYGGKSPGVALPNPAEATPEAYREAAMQKTKAASQPPTLHDDTFDTWPEANTDEEIATMAWALSQTMERLPGNELYYVKGTSAYRVTLDEWVDPYRVSFAELPQLAPEAPFVAVAHFVPVLDDKGEETGDRKLDEIRITGKYGAKVEQIDPASVPDLNEYATRLPWTLSHGVEPAEMALGANGCTDCHAENTHFFYGDIVDDPYGPDGQAKRSPMYASLGFSPAALQWGNWRESWLKPVAPWLVLIAAVMAVLHLAIFGSRRKKEIEGDTQPQIVRFKWYERIGHLALLITVLFLGVTGFFFLLGENDPLGPWARMLHPYVGLAMVVAVVWALLVWFRYAFPAGYDWEWLKGWGGYLELRSRAKHYPAGKFNAGQKMWYWSVLGIGGTLVVTGVLMWWFGEARHPWQQVLYTLHDVAAALFLPALVGHIYLGTLANPHSLNSLFGGTVSALWAREHHSEWAKQQEPKPEA